jgi:glycosyltransferase involved in cell wall biosynthesis
MKTVAIIPVFGRQPLIKHTIERLLNVNGVDHVLCVGDAADKDVCKKAGADYSLHRNSPLGAKWNHGFKVARDYGADAAVFVGSSDWLSANWLDVMLPRLQGNDMIGVAGFTMCDVREDLRSVYWGGYTGQRAGEPIGIGRIISAKALDKMDWKPFDDNRENSMDRTMFSRCRRVKLIEDKEIVALSISTGKWPNKHIFDAHYNNAIEGVNTKFNFTKLLDEFPEILLLQKELYGNV